MTAKVLDSYRQLYLYFESSESIRAKLLAAQSDISLYKLLYMMRVKKITGSSGCQDPRRRLARDLRQLNKLCEKLLQFLKDYDFSSDQEASDQEEGLIQALATLEEKNQSLLRCVGCHNDPPN